MLILCFNCQISPTVLANVLVHHFSRIPAQIQPGFCVRLILGWFYVTNPASWKVSLAPPVFPKRFECESSLLRWMLKQNTSWVLIQTGHWQHRLLRSFCRLLPCANQIHSSPSSQDDKPPKLKKIWNLSPYPPPPKKQKKKQCRLSLLFPFPNQKKPFVFFPNKKKSPGFFPRFFPNGKIPQVGPALLHHGASRLSIQFRNQRRQPPRGPCTHPATNQQRLDNAPPKQIPHPLTACWCCWSSHFWRLVTQISPKQNIYSKKREKNVTKKVTSTSH